MTLAEEQHDFRQWVEGEVNRGSRLTSFVRDAITNQNVGGNVQSQHLLALGADFGLESEGLAERAVEEGYVVVREIDHFHVQRFPAGFLASCGVLS